MNDTVIFLPCSIFWKLVVVVQVISLSCCRFMQSRVTCSVFCSTSPEQYMEKVPYRTSSVMKISIDTWYCFLLKYIVRPDDSYFNILSFYQSYFTRSPYQSILYPLICPSLAYLTEPKTPSGITLWVTESYKFLLSPYQGIDYEEPKKTMSYPQIRIYVCRIDFGFVF